MELLAETKGLAGSLGLKLEMSPSVAEIDGLLRGIAKELQDFRPAWKRISVEVLLPSIKAAFASGTSQEGETWAPLSADWARRKPGNGGPLVSASQRLLLALAKESSGQGAQRQFGKKLARVGTTLSEALPLQWGYGTKSRSAARRRVDSERKTRSAGARTAIPGRPFIAWNDRMREHAAEILVEYLQFVTDNQVALLSGGMKVEAS